MFLCIIVYNLHYLSHERNETNESLSKQYFVYIFFILCFIRKMKKIFILLAAFAFSALSMQADNLRLAHIFTDGMVLQRGATIPVWGWGAQPASQVVVTFGTSKVTTKADAKGAWSVRLPKQQLGEARQLTVSSKGESISINDVLVGDVFLCSGQSNMELPIRRCMDSVANIVKDYNNPNIRYVKIPHTFNYVQPNEDLPNIKWQDIKSTNCSEVGGLCYFMGRRLQEELDVPIGIINSSVGGTPVQAWTPKGVLQKRPEYANEFCNPKYNKVEWVDSVRRVEMRAGTAWDSALRNNGVKATDRQFSKVDIFSQWGKGSGLYWFRKSFMLPRGQKLAGKEATIRLGAMVDADSVWVNGTFVGTTSYQYPPRVYRIPAGVLRDGQNEVMIRLQAEGGNPHFIAQKRYDVEVNGRVIELGKDWEMAVGYLTSNKPASTYFVGGYTGLYNAMISPLRDIPFTAAVWYQGETNLTDGARQYASMLGDMVAAWRQQWHNDFPIAIVQLPYFTDGQPNISPEWGIIQQQQALAARTINKAALVDIKDTGEPNDIHPQDKNVVGRRVADVLLSQFLGKTTDKQGVALDASRNQLPLRLLNHWDNPDGTIERGFSGHSIFKWDQIPADVTVPLPADLQAIYNDYGLTNQQLGINGTVLNNVNAKPTMLSTEMLQKVRRIADILRPYGQRVYVSVNFASPKALGDVDTADPLNKEVIKWWQNKAAEILQLIPDFGGFLVKANSEGEPGPMDYDRTHVDGANMLADALTKAHKARLKSNPSMPEPMVIWRAFVYSAKGGDRASQAHEEFVKFDGQFRDNVIIQIKNGPIDFQPREPLSPLFFALKNTKMMAELQITQEYTGHNVMTCFLAPEWREFIDSINAYKVPLVGFAGVANIGERTFDPAGKGTPEQGAYHNEMTKANWYAFGMLANDSTTSAEHIAKVYLEREWSRDARFVQPISQLLCDSYETLVSYTMPLGLHHIFAGGHHYGPEPWCFHQGWREDWLPRYYHKADANGLGFDRTEKGSGNALLYPEPLRSIYNDENRCPDELKLWFHHVSWNNIWEKLCHTYDKGVCQAESFVDTWRSIKPYVDESRYVQQLQHFKKQAEDAWWWRDGCLLYFQQFSKMPLPADSPTPRHKLDQMMQFNMGIDNYSPVPMNK